MHPSETGALLVASECLILLLAGVDRMGRVELLERGVITP